MTRVEGRTIVDATVDQVFAYASDWTHWSEWFQGVSNFKPLTEVERGNGARYSYRASLLGFQAPVETEIAEFRENQGWKGIGHGSIPHTTFWLFESVGTKTRFTYVQEYRIPIPLIGTLLDTILLKRQWHNIIQSSLANLRHHFEASPVA